jgi:hypothetical protein
VPDWIYLTGANVFLSFPFPDPLFLLIPRKTDQLFMSVWVFVKLGHFL